MYIQEATLSRDGLVRKKRKMKKSIMRKPTDTLNVALLVKLDILPRIIQRSISKNSRISDPKSKVVGIKNAS